MKVFFSRSKIVDYMENSAVESENDRNEDPEGDVNADEGGAELTKFAVEKSDEPGVESGEENGVEYTINPDMESSVADDLFKSVDDEAEGADEQVAGIADQLEDVNDPYEGVYEDDDEDEKVFLRIEDERDVDDFSDGEVVVPPQTKTRHRGYPFDKYERGADVNPGIAVDKEKELERTDGWTDASESEMDGQIGIGISLSVVDRQREPSREAFDEEQGGREPLSEDQELRNANKEDELFRSTSRIGGIPVLMSGTVLRESDGTRRKATGNSQGSVKDGTKWISTTTGSARRTGFDMAKAVVGGSSSIPSITSNLSIPWETTTAATTTTTTKQEGETTKDKSDRIENAFWEKLAAHDEAHHPHQGEGEAAK